MIANSIRYIHCPLCSSERISQAGNISYSQPVHFSTNEIELEFVPELWKCSKCKSSFVQNIVPENTAIALYSKGDSSGRWSGEPFIRQKPSNQIRCLEQYFLPGKSVLDIGCNTGELLDYAKSVGCETAGIEYSQTSRYVLVSKNHLAFSTITEIKEKFDVITAFDLVEHLYDLPAFFKSCREVLNKDGVLIVLTGNAGSLSARLSKSGWWYLKYPEHIAFPSQKYLSEYTGFAVVQWIPTYASKGYQQSWLQVLRGVVGSMRRGRYSGLPSIGPDHVLVVLKSI